MRAAVVVPNRNYARYLGRALRSIREQTVPPDEVIVVDGHSTDNSREVAESFGAQWISVEPRGIANARNIGIAATDCRFVLPLDADDWVEPTFLERTLAALAPAVGIVATGLVWPDGRVQWPAEPINRESLLTGNRLFCCSLFRRQAWAEVGGYDETPGIYEDWHFWGCCVSAGWRVAVVREPLFHYCPHPGSSTTSMRFGDDAVYRERTIAKLRAFDLVGA